MQKNISIFGSTGSIGVQTIDVAKRLGINITAIACNSSYDALWEQIKELKPKYAAVVDEHAALLLSRRAKEEMIDTKIASGIGEAIEVCTADEVGTFVNATVGISGLKPTLEAMKKGKDIALANKETLVTGGEIVMSEANRLGVSILPIDSEHSAIWQSIQGGDKNRIEKILLTCSGGPFRGKTLDWLKGVTPDDALQHPTWKMGNKITIDSATLFNKGLEIIEAKWLFGIDEKDIEVLIHPQSILHSAVQFADGSVIGQLGTHDMRTPIQYALTYPERMKNEFKRLDLIELGKLEFSNPDTETFSSLKIARTALRRGGLYPTVMNGANEEAVKLFLNRKISFLDIFHFVENAVDSYGGNNGVSLESILEADRWSRECVNALARKN